jgi:RHS repeat-associated protein
VDKTTLYTSPYLVATDNGYTKHYYAGTERLCARTGNGNLNHLGNFIENNPAISERADDLFDGCISAMAERTNTENETSGITGVCDKTPAELVAKIEGHPFIVIAEVEVGTSAFDVAMSNFSSITQQTEDVFYYHSDHLGSASWITDANGVPVQHLQYLPFGERYVDQRAAGYHERFTFTGKEKDSETGYYYFGARYYDCDLSGLFLSVDPMSDKYLNISPYHYCHWNPIIKIDPNGNDEWEINQQGKVVNRIETKEHDAFFIVDDKGNRMMDENYSVLYKSISFDYGTIVNKDMGSYLFYTEFNISNNECGIDLFKFLSDNTSVEYGLITTSRNGSVLMTNHKDRTVFVMGTAEEMDKNGLTITSIIHNHPGSDQPSGFRENSTGGDKYAAERLVRSHGNEVQYYVYRPQNGLYQMFNYEHLLGYSSHSMVKQNLK